VKRGRSKPSGERNRKPAFINILRERSLERELKLSCSHHEGSKKGRGKNERGGSYGTTSTPVREEERGDCASELQDLTKRGEEKSKIPLQKQGKVVRTS